MTTNYKNTLKSARSLLGKTAFFSCLEGAIGGASGGIIFYRNQLTINKIAISTAAGIIGNPLICLALVTLFAPCHSAITDCFEQEVPQALLKNPSELIKFLPIITCVSGMTLGWSILKPKNISQEDSPIIGIFGMCFNIAIALLYIIGKLCYTKFKQRNPENTPLINRDVEYGTNNNNSLTSVNSASPT